MMGETMYTYLPVGAHTFTLTVEDSKGSENSDTVEVSVVDTAPPQVSATLTALKKLHKKHGKYRVEFSCSDACSIDTTVTTELNGIAVEDGQIVRLITSKKTKAISRKGQLRILKAPSFSLVVNCEDASGNGDSLTVIPEFAPDRGDDSDDSDN